MTAKHRKGKSNHKQEENFFDKNEATESQARSGGRNPALVLVLFLVIGIGGATGAWFCFQQHQTLTYLTDNLTGMQMKMVKLQTAHEELRQSGGKHNSENLESRLNALEESSALAQKQVSMALATAEQLKTSDLPAQVLSLHTEMKARLAEMQQATVSLEQVSQLQTMLRGKSEEFDDVRIQLERLATVSGELSRKVDVLTGNLGEAQSKLEERDGQLAALSATLDGQTAGVLRLKKQLDTYQSQLEANTLEVATVRELLEKEQSQGLLQAGLEEQLDTVRQSLQEQNSAAHSLHSELKAQLENIQKQVTQLVGETETLGEPVQQTDDTPTDQDAAAASTEEETLATDVGEENEQEEAEEDEAPIKQEDTVGEEAAPVEEVEAVKEDHAENDQSIASSENEEVDTAQTEEEVSEEEESEGEEDEEESPLEEESHKAEEELLETQEAEEETQPEEEMASEGEQVEEESPLEVESHDAEEVEEDGQPEEEEEEEEEEAPEGENVEEESLPEENNHKEEEENASEEDKEEPLLEDELGVEEGETEWQEEEEPTETDASPEDD
ncbi:glutamic acid-rich protein isoform X2 [Anabas testudineus]|uniref:glutamic acid-rich protein isoform X2 n=1 Tax=Anabas testudineus TaxID=64144 RepID=UPI000E455B3B|nr:glutamic acid-rich protein isoform X2 [Anabas testudineus]